MKIFFGTLICFILGFIGIKMSSFYRKKYNFIKDWKKLNEELEIQISFNKKSLQEIIDTFSAKSEDFSNILDNYKEYISNTKDDDFLIHKIEKNLFYKKYKSSLTDYFLTLGKIDYLSQLKLLQNYNKILDDYLNEATKELKSKGGLYSKIGLLIGIMIMIIMV